MMRRCAVRRAWHGDLDLPFPASKTLQLPQGSIEGISVDPVVLEIATYLKLNTNALVLGTPNCGKTSMALRLQALAPTLGYSSAEYFAGNDGSAFAKRFAEDADNQKMLDQRKRRDRLYIIDEAHEALDHIPDFDSKYLKNRPLSILLVGTSAARKNTAGPQLLRPHKHWFFGPTADRKVVSAYAERVLTICDAPFDHRQITHFAASLFDTCAGHIGVIMQALRFAVDNGTFPTLADLTQEPSVHKRTYFSRAVVGTNGSLQTRWSGECLNIAAEILATGVHTVSWDNASEETKTLFRRGFFSPPRNLEAVSPLVFIGTPCFVEMTWTHPHQRQYAEKSQGVKAAPVSKAPPPLEPFELLVGAAAALHVDTTVANRLSGHLAKTNSTTAQETHLDLALTAAIQHTFPEIGGFITKMHPKGDSKKTLDLGIRLVGTARPVWGVEYTLNGAAIAKHLGYFGKGGNYAAMKLKKWIVVDVWTHPPPKPLTDYPDLAQELNYSRISPHSVVGWGAVVIERGKEKYIIPRDGVRRFLNRKTGAVEVAVKLLPKSNACYVRMKLPGRQLVMTDVADTLRKEDLPRTVDGLKSALLLDPLTGPVLQGKGHLLEVYPPGTKKRGTAMGDLDEIEDTPTKEEPHHVEVVGEC